MPAPPATESPSQFACNLPTRHRQNAGCPILATSFCRKGGKSQNLNLRPFCFQPSSSLLTGCKPVGPNYSRPGYDAPAAYKETGATAVVPPPAPRRRQLAARQALRRHAARQMVGDLPGPPTQPTRRAHRRQEPKLRQALETYLAARDQVSAARATLYPTLSAGACRHPRTSLGQRPLLLSRQIHHLQRLVARPARPVGSRISGAASAAPSKPPAPTLRPAPQTRPAST